MTQRAVMVVANGFHDEEAAETVAYLKDHGVDVKVTGIKKGEVTGKHGRQTLSIDTPVADLNPEDFIALFLPGGTAPEALRLDDDVLSFTRRYFEREGAVVGAICHGAQILISAGVLAGRTLTCYEGIRDDVRLAGARYQDKKVVTDGRLVTSRTPKDIPAFNEALVKALGLEDTAAEDESADTDADTAVEAPADLAAEPDAAEAAADSDTEPTEATR